MSSIFGGKKSSSQQSSGNQAYDYIKDTFSPLTAYAGQGAQGIAQLLGGDASGFNAYKDATGFDRLVEQGSRGITGNAAASGLLRSGGTGKAIANYANDMQNQYAGSYLDRLLGMAGLGTNAGQLITSAGQYSQGTSSSKEKPGLGKFIGAVGSRVAASDPRLKHDVTKVDELEDGLNVYTFRYIDGDQRLWKGVMADEVAALRPEALGPLTEDGYMTVNYDKIWRV